MKLIIREYLASLRERDELDALLPDLLSQMGLEVFSKPSVGVRQYGVDVAAFGSIEGGRETVYLFSIKSGDLDRASWNSDNPQDLKPSLDEIRETYIPTHLPSQYSSKPIEICICFGGELKQSMQLTIATYEKNYTTEDVSFSEWSGDRLANYIEKYFLREDLFQSDQSRRLLRKSLAMLDEPDISYKHFGQLVIQLTSNEEQTPKDTLTSIRQLYLCLWILYTWCREADNLESAYLGGELSLLNSWEVGKRFLDKGDKTSKSIVETLDLIQFLHIQISRDYLETKIIPHTGKLHALSHAVHGSCSLDVNLKLFDVLGRLAVTGLWVYWLLLEEVERGGDNDIIINEYISLLGKYNEAVLKLLVNNQILQAPYKDEQAIDVGLASVFLMLDWRNLESLHNWLSNMVGQIHFSLKTNGVYPCNLSSYSELLEHPSREDVDSYLEEVVKGSNLYPLISFLAASLGFDDIYSKVQEIKAELPEHCNFQVWFPGGDSEEHYYCNTGENHGATLSHVSIDKEPSFFRDEILRECKATREFQDLSAIAQIRGPVILLASRHYRWPVPFHFFVTEPEENGAADES